jgi:hypothetical protein
LPIVLYSAEEASQYKVIATCCQRRRFPYFVGAGLVIGLDHEKRTWKKERSTDWFDHIVLETFDDDQWIENFYTANRRLSYSK